MVDDCLFCKIVAGDIPCVSLMETPELIVFMDIMPFNSGHCLIVPRNHSRNLLDANPDDMAAVARVSVQVANAVKKAMNADGVRIFQFNEPAAGQTVFHYHMHVIPVKYGDGFMPHGREQRPVTELQEIADRIRAYL